MNHALQAEARQALMMQLEQGNLDGLIARSTPTPQTLEMLANNCGLAPGLSLLLHALIREDRGFARQAIAALPVQREIAGLPSRWLLALSEHLGQQLRDPALRNLVAQVSRLHQQVLAAEPIEPSAWRRTRSAFPPADSGAEQMVAAIVAASAWDPFSVPGAVADSVLLFHEAAQRQWDAEHDWGPADDEWAEGLETAAGEHARIVAGCYPDDDQAWFETADGQAWVARCEQAHQAYHQEHGARLEQRAAGIKAAYQTLLGSGRGLLLDVCSASG